MFRPLHSTLGLRCMGQDEPSSSSALANCVRSRLPRSCLPDRLPGGNMPGRCTGLRIDDLPEHQCSRGRPPAEEQSEGDCPGGVVHGADESQMWSGPASCAGSQSAAAFPPGGSAPFEGSAWALGDDEGFRLKEPAGRWSETDGPSRSASISVKCEWLKPE